MDQGSIELIDDYINDLAKFEILDNDCISEEQKQGPEKEKYEEPSPRRRISIEEFIKKYIVDICSTSSISKGARIGLLWQRKSNNIDSRQNRSHR